MKLHKIYEHMEIKHYIFEQLMGNEKSRGEVEKINGSNSN
jgi:hypothetical protein